VSNTLVGPSALVEFGTFTDTLVDAAVASVRREADWHIAPRLTETIELVVRRGAADELPLPTRSFPDAQVLVSAVTRGGTALTGWDQADGVLILGHRPAGWGGVGRIRVTLTHGFVECPPELLPVIAQRASSARSPRDPRTSSFSNGAVQMSFRDATQLDPVVAKYAVIGGVA
jgi:hypothetical protein